MSGIYDVAAAVVAITCKLILKCKYNENTMHYRVMQAYNVISFSDAIEFKVRSRRLQNKNTEQK